MTFNDKQQLIEQVTNLLQTMINVDNEDNCTLPHRNSNEAIEMLTIKECSAAISGLSEHTVRQLVAQDKIKYIRTGQGRSGKILVSKMSLLNYLNGASEEQ